ncbi:hypothetical protein DFJ73DRAFT_817735 [Zopfochytrium polystomum]|nr:hypothetical protein DFJ73DRAFT_817735 [Zopfochytrium polystomum]
MDPTSPKPADRPPERATPPTTMTTATAAQQPSILQQLGAAAAIAAANLSISPPRPSSFAAAKRKRSLASATAAASPAPVSSATTTSAPRLTTPQTTIPIISSPSPSVLSLDNSAETPAAMIVPFSDSGRANSGSMGSPSLAAAINNVPEKKVTSTAKKAVPAFLSKLYTMVTEGSSNLIRWSDDGQSFIVEDHEGFAREVLPRYFKHNNFSSFVRQLNMYGFHKVPHLQAGSLVLDVEPEHLEFANPHFQRNQPDLLALVTRKKGSLVDRGEEGQVDATALLHEIAAIKRHQLAISADMKSIQRENQVLWAESMAIREQHRRQQQTIDKILRFLASVFSSRKRGGPILQTPSPKRKKSNLLLRESGETPELEDDYVRHLSSPKAVELVDVDEEGPIHISSLQSDANLDLSSSSTVLADGSGLWDTSFLGDSEVHNDASSQIFDLIRSPNLSLSTTSMPAPSSAPTVVSSNRNMGQGVSNSLAAAGAQAGPPGSAGVARSTAERFALINQATKSLQEDMELLDERLDLSAALLGVDPSMFSLDSDGSLFHPDQRYMLDNTASANPSEGMSAPIPPSRPPLSRPSAKAAPMALPSLAESKSVSVPDISNAANLNLPDIAAILNNLTQPLPPADQESLLALLKQHISQPGNGPSQSSSSAALSGLTRDRGNNQSVNAPSVDAFRRLLTGTAPAAKTPSLAETAEMAGLSSITEIAPLNRGALPSAANTDDDDDDIMKLVMEDGDSLADLGLLEGLEN